MLRHVHISWLIYSEHIDSEQTAIHALYIVDI